MNLEQRPINQTIRNVNGNIRCVILTPQLSIAQLYCDHSQVWGNGHYIVYVDLSSENPTIQMKKLNKELPDDPSDGVPLEALSQDQYDIILPTLSEELKEWLLFPGVQTRKLLALHLRTTEHTVVQEHNLRTLRDVFRGKSISKRLLNLITNHRIGSHILPDPFEHLYDLSEVTVASSRIKQGEKDIISTDWLVFYSNGPATYLTYRQGMESNPIDHKNIVLALQIIHDTSAVGAQWIQIKAYR